jgi:hypothetical protein
VLRDRDGILYLKAETGRPIGLPEGRQTWELTLKRGTMFILGETAFACDESTVSIPDVRQPQEKVASTIGASELTGPPEMLGLNCATCHRIVATLPVAARFCPRCGSTLANHRPDLSFFADVFTRPQRRGLFSWLLPLRRVDLNWRAIGRRPSTLIAYVNSLLNMARRYEDAHGADKNLSQAIRYYEKAARLGSGTAREKLNSPPDEQSGEPPFAKRV